MRAQDADHHRSAAGPDDVVGGAADTNWVVIAIMSFAFFAQGVASASWSLIGDIAPRSMLGVTGGAVNSVGNLSGIVTPIAIGFIVRETVRSDGRSG
ncbi:hypothetical protein [Burkholderia cenocepacia]|nr:hypothetical protein [Burkholderia cenocepacia]